MTMYLVVDIGVFFPRDFLAWNRVRNYHGVTSRLRLTCFTLDSSPSSREVFHHITRPRVHMAMKIYQISETRRNDHVRESRKVVGHIHTDKCTCIFKYSCIIECFTSVSKLLAREWCYQDEDSSRPGTRYSCIALVPNEVVITISACIGKVHPLRLD
jgi:hypothetical protein